MLAAAVAQNMQFPAQKVRFKANLLALLTHKTCSQPLLAERLSQSEKSALARPTSINLVVIALVAACTHSASEHTSRLIHKHVVLIARTYIPRSLHKRMVHIAQSH